MKRNHINFSTRPKIYSTTLVVLISTSFGCLKNPVQTETPSETASRYLYVASGSCYSGAGNTTFSNITSSNTVFRINLSTGLKDVEIADYNSTPSQFGDTPVGLTKSSDNQLYILVENTTTVGARRIEKMPTTENAERSLFSNNTTALSAQLRKLTRTSGGDLLISKSTAVEKITSNNTRITNGANPFINSPAAPCATSNTLISDVITLSNNYIAFSHAAASQNRIGFVKPSGYGTTGDCSPAQSAPNANSYPTSMAYDSSNKILFVSYAGNATTTDLNSIYAYVLNETSNSVSITASHKIYDSSLYGSTYNYLLYGISKIIFDQNENALYVATAINNSTTISNYAIEKFIVDQSKLGTANSEVLTKSDLSPFYNYGGDTKCISDMMISD